MKILALFLGLVLAAGCAHATPGDPRGIRTNNPGNIVKTSIEWQGEVQCSDKINECFESDYYGIRALVKVLHTYYYKHGLGTIDQIMARFSEFGGAARGVSRISGIPTNKTLDFSDLGEVMSLTKAIILQENGVNPYEDDLIEQVLYDTYGNHHFGSVNPSDSAPEDMEQEARHAEGAAQSDDASPRGQHEGKEGNPGGGRSGIQLDSQDNSVIVCVCNSYSPEDGGAADAARARNSWLDRIAGWIAVFLSGERGQANVARSEGLCNHTP